MELDQELKNLALDWAEKVYADIYMAITNPDRSISGQELKLYDEFKAWGFFDKLPLITPNDEDEQELAHSLFIMVLAIDRYRKLKHDKDHPPPRKKSKWEVVTGKVPRK